MTDNRTMGNANRDLIQQLNELISEEMYLLGQELNDSLVATERSRLRELSTLLDEASDLLAKHRAARPHRSDA